MPLKVMFNVHFCLQDTVAPCPGGQGGPDTQLSLGLMHSSLLFPYP